jgi:two-component system nitrate/nitrite response regulator NarL
VPENLKRIVYLALAAALDLDRKVAVVGVAASAEEAVFRFHDRSVDVVLADASTSAGVHAVRSFAESEPQAKLVALASLDDSQSIVDCAEAGVSGFVASDGTLDDVVSAVDAVARGEVACTSKVVATLMRRVTTIARQRVDPNRLTGREREILALIDHGMSNKEIAAKLYIEVSTVKNHVHNILEKLGARRRSEAAARARKQFIPG